MDNKISHSGVWHIDSRSEAFAGQLHLDFESGYFTLEFSISASSNLNDHLRSQKLRKIPLILGDTYNGIKITLVDCLILNFKYIQQEDARYVLHVEKVYIGKHLETNMQVFNCYQFKVPELIKWTGLCKYNTEYNDSEPATLSIKWVSNSPVVIFVKDKLSLKISAHHGDTGWTMYDPEISIIQYIQISLSYYEPCQIDQAISDYMTFLKLVNIGCQDHLQGNTFCCLYCENCNENQDSSPIQVYIAQPRIAPNNTAYYDYLFALNDLSKHPQVISNWYLKVEELSPVVNLYQQATQNLSLPVEIKFLTLVQALETYHSRFLSVDPKEYRHRVERILNIVPADEAEYYKAHLVPPTYTDELRIKLVNRLSDLFLCDFRVVFKTMSDFLVPFDYVDKIIATRNYLTHYNKDKHNQALSGVKLFETLICLRNVLEYYILREIGFPSTMTDYAVEKTNRKIENQKRIYHI